MSEPPDENTPPDPIETAASMQVRLPVTLVSASRAQDAGYLALADVAALATQLGVDYRVVGGHMVSLLVEAYRVTGVPPRETADADFGAAAPVVADQALLAALDRRGYRQVAGNRFERSVPTGAESVTGPGQSLDLAIDVLVPSYTHRHLPNQEVGDLVVDAIPGLSLALARSPTSIDVTVHLREQGLAEQVGLPDTFTVLVPDPVSALTVKALAWASRKADRDAADVWRLLEVAAVTGITPNGWTIPVSAPTPGASSTTASDDVTPTGPPPQPPIPPAGHGSRHWCNRLAAARPRAADIPRREEREALQPVTIGTGCDAADRGKSLARQGISAQTTQVRGGLVAPL